VTDRPKRRLLAGTAVAFAAIVISFAAAAADLLPAPPPPSPGIPPPPPPVVAPLPNGYDPYRYELRFGAFMHGVGGIEKGTYDLSPELILPRLPFGQNAWWSFLVPRPHAGALFNLEGRTSAVFFGALWSLPLPHRFFAEMFVDGADHNGYQINPPPGHAGLGCPLLFHVGGSGGYSFDQHWNVTFTFDHLSNGKHVFGTQCNGLGSNTPNPGLNNYGARLGYAF
jgi:lipid A 3-O-deacylase